MKRTELTVVAFVAIGLLIFVQVLRVTTSGAGRSPSARHEATIREDRERRLLLRSMAVRSATSVAAGADAQAVAQPAGSAASAAVGQPSAAAGAAAGAQAGQLPQAAPASACPKNRPYHTLLTAQTTTYQQWQSRIMYYHWKKQRAADMAAHGGCTDMAQFSRLASSKDGAADGLEAAMPTIYIKQLPDEVIRAHFHFGVLNRPHSVKTLLQTPELAARIPEEYVFIAETDHVLLRPLPNLATAEKPAAYVFGYMHAGPHVDWVVKRYWPEGSYKDVDPVGPSPCIIHKAQLATFVDDWLDFSLGLRSNADAEAVIQGWVQEMWGYSIAAAKHGVRHTLVRDFQTEPSAFGRHIAPTYTQKYYIHHYTYGIEYKMDGEPQGVNQIGEWSLDKRHYGGAFPPKGLMEPPPAGANAAAVWLTNAWNEAMDADPTWPDSKALGTVGWRRECASEAEVAAHSVARKLIGTKWTWAGIPGLGFTDHCDLKTPWGTGKWGLLKQSRFCDAKCAAESIFVDFSGGAHNVHFELDSAGKPVKFVSTRIGDAEQVTGLPAAG